jgi:Firmicute plasmid replication protein (RepL)
MSLNGYPSYEHNPFRLNPKSFRSLHSFRKVVDKETGEVDYEDTEVASDMESHIRLYQSAFKDIPNLNSFAVAILCYIFQNVTQDEVRLAVQELMDYFKISSKNTVYRGIKDLLDNEFIVRKASYNMYFINPSKFYRGKRTTYHLKTADIDEQIEVRKILCF